MAKNCYVYVIECKHHIKIGIAHNIKSRMRSLQTASPFYMNLLGYIDCPSRHEAYSLERELHRNLSFCSGRGEWFKMCLKGRKKSKYGSRDNVKNIILNKILKVVNEKPRCNIIKWPDHKKINLYQQGFAYRDFEKDDTAIDNS